MAEDEVSLLVITGVRVFVMIDGAWKERGQGELRLLMHTLTRRTRLCVLSFPRRATPAGAAQNMHARLLANMLVEPDIVLVPAPSEGDPRNRAFIFEAADYADRTSPSVRQTFAYRFKSEEMAAVFAAEFAAASARNAILLHDGAAAIARVPLPVLHAGPLVMTHSPARTPVVDPLSVAQRLESPLASARAAAAAAVGRLSSAAVTSPSRTLASGNTLDVSIISSASDVHSVYMPPPPRAPEQSMTSAVEMDDVTVGSGPTLLEPAAESTADPTPVADQRERVQAAEPAHPTAQEESTPLVSMPDEDGMLLSKLTAALTPPKQVAATIDTSNFIPAGAGPEVNTDATIPALTAAPENAQPVRVSAPAAEAPMRHFKSSDAAEPDSGLLTTVLIGAGVISAAALLAYVLVETDKSGNFGKLAAYTRNGTIALRRLAAAATTAAAVAFVRPVTK